MKRALALLPLLLLGGCAQPFEGRIAAKVHEAGIPRPMAECMAERWVDRLSLPQLRKIEQLADDLRRQYSDGSLTVLGFVDRVDRLDDAEILRVTTSSAARCALRV